MSCKHFNFRASVNVCRLTADTDPEKIVGYTADITVTCDECGLPFEFVGFPEGVSVTNTKPMVSVGRLELRAPLIPSSDAVDHVNAILKSNA